MDYLSINYPCEYRASRCFFPSLLGQQAPPEETPPLRGHPVGGCVVGQQHGSRVRSRGDSSMGDTKLSLLSLKSCGDIYTPTLELRMGCI